MSHDIVDNSRSAGGGSQGLVIADGNEDSSHRLRMFRPLTGDGVGLFDANFAALMGRRSLASGYCEDRG